MKAPESWTHLLFGDGLLPHTWHTLCWLGIVSSAGLLVWWIGRILCHRYCIRHPLWGSLSVQKGVALFAWAIGILLAGIVLNLWFSLGQRTEYIFWVRYGTKFFGACALSLAGVAVARLVEQLLQKLCLTYWPKETVVAQFLSQLAWWAIVLLTGILALDQVGVQTSSLLTVLGALVLSVGLSLKNTLSHLAAGFVLVMLRPFKVGEQVEVAGIKGRIDRIALLTTRLIISSGPPVTILNGLILSKQIVNYSRGPGLFCIRMKLQICSPRSPSWWHACYLDWISKQATIANHPSPSIQIESTGGDGMQIWLLKFWADSISEEQRVIWMEELSTYLKGIGLSEEVASCRIAYHPDCG